MRASIALAGLGCALLACSAQPRPPAPPRAEPSALATPEARQFVEALYHASPPTGQWRYYDGMLYLLALLHVSGQFRIIAAPPGAMNG